MNIDLFSKTTPILILVFRVYFYRITFIRLITKFKIKFTQRRKYGGGAALHFSYKFLYLIGPDTHEAQVFGLYIFWAVFAPSCFVCNKYAIAREDFSAETSTARNNDIKNFQSSTLYVKIISPYVRPAQKYVV